MSQFDKIDLVFLGTMSGAPPSGGRNQSCTVLRMDNVAWMFDCGDGSQGQLQRSTLSSANITRIFITHLHGDHCFGLPGMLCNIAVSSAGKAQRDPVILVGPVGLRDLVRVTLGTTYCRLGDWRFSVHELAEVPAPPGLPHTYSAHPALPHVNEVEGLMIHPIAPGQWVIPATASDRGVTVKACALPHTVPTVGFVITEGARLGKLDVARARPIIERHALPSSTLGRLKNGESIQLPSGEVLNPADFVGPSPRPRCVVILGDTYAGDAVASIVSECDVLVHEATNACLAGDLKEGVTISSVEEQAIAHGHSTPQMAAKTAVAINASSLALFHFSPRYKGDSSAESGVVMEEIAKLAHDILGRPVFCARDFDTINIAIGGAVTLGAPSLLQSKS